MAKVLVIDDDPQLLHMVGMMLERGGHTPILENDPRNGIERIMEEQPDVLVLDVMMPEMSGHELCEKIRNTEEIAELPILMLTARSQAVDRQVALASGADDYLSKPVLPRELMEYIDKLLGPEESSDANDSGMVISVFGMRGGSGRTTLAANLSTALRRTSGQEVCLIDLSPSGGQAVTHLRLQARTTWNDLLPLPQLDWSVVKEHLLLHPSGMRVLAAPKHALVPTVPSSEVIAELLSILKENARFVVVDLPSVFSLAVRTVLEQSDMVLHVVNPEVVSVQVALHTSQALAQANYAFKQKLYVLNQVVPEAQLPAAAVEKGLKARIACRIGYDSNQARALAQGVPLSLTPARSSLPTMTQRLADAIWKRQSQEIGSQVEGHRVGEHLSET